MTAMTMYDYSVVLKDAENVRQTWEGLIPQGLTMGKQIEELLKLSVSYPLETASFTYKVLAAYLLLPSALCDNVPIAFLYGASGSGKSQVSKFASGLWNCKIFSPADTFAAIRNDIDKRKRAYVDIPVTDSEISYRKEVEANTFMIWDDIDPSILTTKPDIFRMLKVGCDRKTSTITISSGITGENSEFDCFSPKIFSSVTPLHSISEFGELKRRMLIFPHKRNEFLPIFIDDYDWSSLHHKLNAFWDLTSARAFIDFRSRLNHVKKLRDAIDPARWYILRDFIATGFITGIWHRVEDAVEDLTAFFNWQVKLSELTKDALEGLLSDFILINEQSNCQAISSMSISRRVDDWVKNGMLFDRPVRGQVAKIMRDLGYVLTLGNWHKDN